VIIGKFGPKTFETTQNKILTFRDFSVSGDLNTSTEEASQKKPATTVKGPGLLKINAELPLLARFGVNVRTEIDSWFAIKDSKITYPFVLCGKAVSLNSFLLTNCESSDYVITKAGAALVIASAVLKLEFTEYLPPGASKSSGGNSNGAAGVKSSVSVSNPYKVPTTTQKAAAKRVNKGMSG